MPFFSNEFDLVNFIEYKVFDRFSQVKAPPIIPPGTGGMGRSVANKSSSV